MSPPPGRRLSLGVESFADLPSVAPTGEQLAFEELGTPLHETTFVVVDLETTGTAPTSDRITEIGAVKVRGGEVLGEFATLVNPGIPIPPQITVLTGITTSMCIDAPPIAQVLPAFLEFARGAVLVAHNARFDMGFLRAAARELSLPFSPTQVVDTVALARRVVTKDEAPNHKLGTLARLFRAEISPDHRALNDARATVDVLHGLLGRMASLGVTHAEDLDTAADRVPPARRRKVTLAEHLPTGPGVYSFVGPSDQVLYIGTAKNLRRRVRTYFTASEERKRIGEMVDLAVAVTTIDCPTAIEASVRELRMIAEHAPPYNRRSKAPARAPWVRLTTDALPRASIVRNVPAGTPAIGPFASRGQAELAAEALQAVGVRGCTTVLPAVVAPAARSCVLADLGRCTAPCIDQDATDAYPARVAAVAHILEHDPSPLCTAHLDRMLAFAEAERFEEAARTRDQLLAFLTGSSTWQRLRPFYEASQVVAARWDRDLDSGTGAWEFIVVRYGRLAASGVCPGRVNPTPFIDHLVATAAHVPAPKGRGGAATPAETKLLVDWCEADGARLVEFTGADWALPITGAAKWLDALPSQSAR